MWSSKHPPIAWNKVCSPVEYGGLGIRDLRAWNKALLSKTLWNIHVKKDSLWVKWVHHYYWDDILKWRWRKDDTHLVKKLIEIRDELMSREGSWAEVERQMASWFGKPQGLLEAYKSFIPDAGKWPWKPVIWKPNILPKHRFAFWIFAHGKCLTKDRQPYILDKSCGLCGIVDEDIHHVFFQCTAPTQLWIRLWNWLGVRGSPNSLGGLLRWLRRRFRGTGLRSKFCHVGVAATVYHIWNARNRAIFDGEKPEVDDIFRKIVIHMHRTMATY